MRDATMLNEIRPREVCKERELSVTTERERHQKPKIFLRNEREISWRKRQVEGMIYDPNVDLSIPHPDLDF